MIEDLIQSLAVAKARAVTLERSVAKKIHKELRALPIQYGFQGVEAFIEALKASAPSAGRKVKPKAAKRSKRTKITAAIRAQVKKLIGAGKTGAEVAKKLGISLPSVQNIKKALGLVGPKKIKSPRKAAAPKAPAKAKPPAKKAKKKTLRKPKASEPVRVSANLAPDTAVSVEPIVAKA